MIPYEKSERLQTVRNHFKYDLRKTQVLSNVARNSLILKSNEASPAPKRKMAPAVSFIRPLEEDSLLPPLIHQPSSSKESPIEHPSYKVGDVDL